MLSAFIGAKRESLDRRSGWSRRRFSAGRRDFSAVMSEFILQRIRDSESLIRYVWKSGSDEERLSLFASDIAFELANEREAKAPSPRRPQGASRDFFSSPARRLKESIHHVE